MPVFINKLYNKWLIRIGKNREIYILSVNNRDKMLMYRIKKSRLGFTSMYITEHQQLRLD